MSLPLLELTTASPAEVLAVLQQHGASLVRDARVPVARSAQALADAAAFFALPAPAKAAVGIAASPHFRGYSEMHNERDWREQIHFGREQAAVVGEAEHLRLLGPNLWPVDAAWRQRLLAWMAAVADVGRRVLAFLATWLGLPADAFAEPKGRAAYLLLKLICYHAQPAGSAPRPGVAAHLDFSWVTLTLQDDTGGLQVRNRAGRWLDVTPVAGTLLVHVGELLQYASGNRLLATPHRVVNPSAARQRLSLPLFLNSALDATVAPLVPPVPAPDLVGEHVHAVLSASAPPVPFGFGEAEWRRKGQNVWCAECCARC